MKIWLGARWGALTVTDMHQERVKRKHGTDSAVTTEQYEQVMDLRCDCGKVLPNLLLREFPGKRIMKDCGCGLATHLKGRPVSSHVSSGTIDMVESYARAKGVSRSRAIEWLLCDALAQWEADKETDKGKGAAKGAGKEVSRATKT